MRSILRPLVLLVALPLFALTACGGGDDEGTTDQPRAAGGAFPVSVKNKFGTAEIKAAPKRVVVVGLVEQDALLALGVTPVATTEWFGDKPGTVAQLDGAPDYGVGWQDITRTVGQAVGKAKEAGELIKGVEGQFEQARAAHPEFKGKAAIMASPYDGYFVYGSQDPRSRLLTDLGFTLPSDLDKLLGGKFGANISTEKAALLDQQAIVWFPEKGGTAKLLADPVYKALNVAKQGRGVYIEEDYGNDLYGATSFVSVLSLPTVLDQLVPKLAKAVDGDPATT